MTLDLVPLRMASKGVTEGGAYFVTRPSERGKMDRKTAEPSRWSALAKLVSEREQRTSPAMEGSICEAGDPRPELESAHIVV